MSTRATANATVAKAFAILRRKGHSNDVRPFVVTPQRDPSNMPGTSTVAQVIGTTGKGAAMFVFQVKHQGAKFLMFGDSAVQVKKILSDKGYLKFVVAQIKVFRSFEIPTV